MSELRDDRLTAALRDLPAAAPGPAFTARVLARLERTRSAPRRALQPWVPAATAVGLLVGGLWAATAGHQSWLRQQRRAALRSESAAIARELAALHEEVSRPQPVLYLGGNEHVDVVLDLSTLPIAAAAPAAMVTRP